MSKMTRPFPQFLRLCAAAAIAWAATGAGAGEVILAATALSGASASPGTVQDLGRIDVGAAYDAQVRRELHRHARHPDAGRASPRKLNGKVDIDFDVNGDGSLNRAGIVRSSSSNALDGAALRTVALARFQPIPDAAQPDALPRRYRVTFDYRYSDTP